MMNRNKEREGMLVPSLLHFNSYILRTLAA
jgi:hypothetical protein